MKQLTTILKHLSPLGLCLLILFEGIMPAQSMTGSPFAFKEEQPHGGMTPELFVNGDGKFQYMTDSEGYMVIENDNRTFVFAALDVHLGCLVPTQMVVGETNPVEMEELVPNATPNLTMRETMCGRMCQETSETDRQEFTASVMMPHVNITGMRSGSRVRKNLVILIQFADHNERTLPPPGDFDILFNSPVPRSPIAPSGSVRGYVDINSYGLCQLESVIVGWIPMPESEAYYADGQKGLSDVFLEALVDALDAVDVDGFRWENLDEDGDRIVDTVTLIHSGYAAEWGRTDQDGQSMHNRIWSHQWSLPSWKRWTSRTGIQVRRYITCPGLWDTRGSEIGRIGVIVHELGHYLGLPDLYGSGSATDTGVGVYCVMGNAWGFDYTQHNPPHLCPWSRVKLGWSHPINVREEGTLEIAASSVADQVYRIDLNPSASEYLLVENRQRHSFDRNLPGAGLAIWHIDESASHRIPGYPRQNGWPENGRHYKVALLQADGDYDLEQGVNFADETDLFHGNGRNSIGPSGSGLLPTTDTYHGGVVESSDVLISDISHSSLNMNFKVSFSNAATSPAPTPSPSTLSERPSSTISMDPSASPQTREIATSLHGGNGAEGCMFDIRTSRDLVIVEVNIHTFAISTIEVEVWSKLGTFQGFEGDQAEWQLIASERVLGRGFRETTSVPVTPLHVNGNQVVAFYITIASGETLAYTNGGQTGMLLESNQDIRIFEGVGKSYPFGRTHVNRQWNGALQYYVHHQPSSLATSFAPTATPSASPSAYPSIPHPQTHRDLETTFIGGTEQAGNMFDILTFKTLLITGFDLHVSFVDDVIVEVYTKLDSFRGMENSCDGWTQIARTVVRGQGTGNVTPLPPNSFTPILAERFLVRSFYITVVSRESGGVRYTRGTGTEDSIAKDDNLAIFEGVGKSYPCLKTFQNRIWNGVLQYSLLEDALAFETTFVGGKQAAGIMFDVTAIQSLTIVGLDLHVSSEREVALEIFIRNGTHVGYEDKPNEWRQVASTTLVGNGRGFATPVPSAAFDPITLASDHTMGFYITFTENEMRYSNGGLFADDVFANSDMEVSKGVGRDFPFGNSYSNRVWNGSFKYLI